LRDAYIRRLETAYRTPIGQADPDDDDTTTSRLFANNGFPLERHPAPVLAIATRGLLFHEKRKTPPPIAIRPIANMSTGSATAGVDDHDTHARRPRPLARPGAGRADRSGLLRGREVGRCGSSRWSIS
jgi:hypothetical protein